MFSPQDKQYIIEKLLRGLATSSYPRETLTASFVDTDLPLILKEGNIQEMILDAVRICIDDGWNHDPMWMQLLLETFQLPLIDGKINQIWEKARHRPPPAPDPLSSTILFNGTPFLNRQKLRTQLNRLESVAGNAQPILVVNGGEKTGKSYSLNYIEYFCDTRQSIVPCPIIIDPGTEFDTGPVDVASNLVNMMGFLPLDIPQPNTNQKKYTADLAMWVLTKAATLPDKQHWFILDNFNIDGLRTDTRDLLITLSELITKGVFPRRCRLIIIGFDRAHLTVEPGRVEEEVVQASTTEDIDITIAEILRRGLSATTPATLNEVADFIKINLPIGRQRMTVLNNRLRVLLHAVINVSTILSDIPGVKYDEILKQMLANLRAEENAMEELKKRLTILEESKKEL